MASFSTNCAYVNDRLAAIAARKGKPGVEGAEAKHARLTLGEHFPDVHATPGKNGEIVDTMKSNPVLMAQWRQMGLDEDTVFRKYNKLRHERRKKADADAATAEAAGAKHAGAAAGQARVQQEAAAAAEEPDGGGAGQQPAAGAAGAAAAKDPAGGQLQAAGQFPDLEILAASSTTASRAAQALAERITSHPFQQVMS